MTCSLNQTRIPPKEVKISKLKNATPSPAPVRLCFMRTETPSALCENLEKKKSGHGAIQQKPTQKGYVMLAIFMPKTTVQKERKKEIFQKIN